MPASTTQTGHSLGSETLPECATCGDRRFVRREVAVDHPDFGKAIPCPDCSHKAIVEQVRGSLPELVREATFASTDKRGPDSQHPLADAAGARWRSALNDAYLMAAGLKREPWLVLAGGYGVGKSHVAACFVNERLEHADLPTPVFVRAIDLFEEIRSGYGDDTARDIRARYKSLPCLVIDDLGKERGTVDEKANLYDILDHRYEKRLETIVTTNGDVHDGAIADRLADIGTGVVRKHTLNHASYRSGR